ncbi:hypothetical protein EMCRGX_G033524 [Ephydatia muelleri]
MFVNQQELQSTQQSDPKCQELGRGGDVVVRHNHLCDICQFLSLCPSINILVQGWDRGMPAAFYVTVTSPLTPVTPNEASVSVAAHTAEIRKHAANDRKPVYLQTKNSSCLNMSLVRSVARTIMGRELVQGHLKSCF